MRVGIGYDIHPLVAGRPLILGGVCIPHEKGLRGHSDADVLTHAVCNALLGALGEPDLGSRYPNSDPAYENYPSTRFLQEVHRLVRERGYRIVNIDSVIVAQAPKLSPYLAQMRDQLAKTVGADPLQIGVKAATPEGLGALGAGEGVAAQAVCLIERST